MLGHQISKFLSSIVPGLFIIGYVIGTGSVTTMAVSGARYGMSLTWSLLLSCIFTACLLTNISKLTIISENTLIYNIKKHIHPALGVFLVVSLMISAISSIIGVTGIVGEIMEEWTKILFKSEKGISPLITSFLLASILYGLFWNGKHKVFIKSLSFMVSIMAICFVLAMFMVIPDTNDILMGLLPKIPKSEEAHLVIGSMVGTTMASVCLVARSTLVKEQGWKMKDLKIERRDVLIAMTLTFLISVSIIAVAAGTLNPIGVNIENAVEMLYTLEPLVGKFSISIFAVGILCAGFSSVFPNMLLLPWLINDYKGSNFPMKNSRFRFLVLFIALSGMSIPIFGGKPVVLMIASQALSPLVLPVLIGAIIYLLNNERVTHGIKMSLVTKMTLYTILLFSIVMCLVTLSGFVSVLST